MLGLYNFLDIVVFAGISSRAGRGNGVTRCGWADLSWLWRQTLAWRLVGGKFCGCVGDAVSVVEEVHFIGDEIGGRAGDIFLLKSMHNHSEAFLSCVMAKLKEGQPLWCCGVEARFCETSSNVVAQTCGRARIVHGTSHVIYVEIVSISFQTRFVRFLHENENWMLIINIHAIFILFSIYIFIFIDK